VEVDDEVHTGQELLSPIQKQARKKAEMMWMLSNREKYFASAII
jgi:hypothetical protein